MGCDVIAARTDRGTVFAKNSDRPAEECQPLYGAPRRAYGRGAVVRCQYLEIDQAPETLAVLGSRPWWLWGFEHGVNEAGVAIGNTALFTRDDVPATGLLGMDLVRLALERARDAGTAKDVITSLLDEHGQGGSAAIDRDRRYHNSYLIADPEGAWVLETSGRHWVAKRMRRAAAISNLATIGDDWDECSDGIDAYARERGWWSAPAGVKLDFRAAFDDPAVRVNAEGRFAQSCRYLDRAAVVDAAGAARHLRDHIATGPVPHPNGPGRPSVCIHPGAHPSATAASIVVELPSRDAGSPVAWCGMTTPCTTALLPVPVGATLPEVLTAGDGVHSDASAWWRLKRVEQWVEGDPEPRSAVVRRQWAAWEARWVEETRQDLTTASTLLGVRTAELLDRADAFLVDLVPR
jgi:secernin